MGCRSPWITAQANLCTFASWLIKSFEPHPGTIISKRVIANRLLVMYRVTYIDPKHRLFKLFITLQEPLSPCSTIGRPPSLHIVIILIPPHSLDPVLPSNDIPRVQQAGQPPQKSEKYVEAEVCSASSGDQDCSRREEDGEYEEDDA